ncbi:3111_t:CDS:2 [Paraglomus occultum]|uniref:3111_t:CDS:1 n=1 Tax=Paraglomus occultum TaxID=144539 RepID=A0A9N9GQQ5_9GLOM|nr:3111_t:CDS:2 [Paraglomus occultum]
MTYEPEVLDNTSSSIDTYNNDLLVVPDDSLQSECNSSMIGCSSEVVSKNKRRANNGEHEEDMSKKTRAWGRVQDNNKRTGAERMECEYEEEICEIVGDNPVYNEVYSSANRKRSSTLARQEKAEQNKKRSDTLDNLVELYQQTRNETENITTDCWLFLNDL